MSPLELTRALKGKWHGAYGTARCPAHHDRSPSLSIGIGKNDATLVRCHTGCSQQAVIDSLRGLGLWSGEPSNLRPVTSTPREDRNGEYALKRWEQSIPLPGTLGWSYFTEKRGLDIGRLGNLNHVLRWNQDIRAVVALMTDPVINKPTGIHRTFLNPGGTKRERKMLGKVGVIRLSPDEDVIEGLGITEGLEDGLAVLLSGWAPVWAATSAGAIDRFPVLGGVEFLTIFADNDEVGRRAAETCAERWVIAGREVRLSPLKESSDEGLE